MNSSEKKLKDGISFNKGMEFICALAVIFGLCIEVVLATAYREHKTWLESWSPVIVDTMIALGVLGELVFSRRVSESEEELRLVFEKKIADANERAANADLARVKLETELAPRSLTSQQLEKLKELKGKVSTVGITPASDLESSKFALQIGAVLHSAEISVQAYTPRIGLVWPGLYIVLPESQIDFNSNPLFKIFKEAGLSVGCGNRSMVPLADIPPELPVIMVGEKRFSYGFPPPPVFGISFSDTPANDR